MHTPKQKQLASIVNVFMSQGVMSVKRARKFAREHLRDTSCAANLYANPPTLRDWSRVAFGDEGEECEYGFMPDSIVTDEQAQEWCECERITTGVPWDCSGRRFTVSITWHRNPCGVYSYVHTTALDI